MRMQLIACFCLLLLLSRRNIAGQGKRHLYEHDDEDNRLSSLGHGKTDDKFVRLKRRAAVPIPEQEDGPLQPGSQEALSLPAPVLSGRPFSGQQASGNGRKSEN